MERPKIENPKFFELLKKKEIIPDDFIDDLLEELEGNALDVLATLIQGGVGSKRKLCQVWCDSIGIAHVDLEKSLFQPRVVRKIPERFARQFYAIPVYQMGDTITVATATPDSEEVKKEISRIVGGPVNLVFALPQDIEWSIENEYQTNTTLYEFFKKIKTSRAFASRSIITEDKLYEAAGPEAVNQLHVCLILYGITENASEIVIESEGNTAKIYFIINDRFMERIHVEEPVYQQLKHNLNHLAKLDPATENEPRYARILFPTPGKKIDISFLSLPENGGEKIYLKLMDRCPHRSVYDLSGLYLSHKNLEQLKRVVEPLSGVLLISGPPASGKTAMAYSILKAVSRPGMTAMTVEDTIKFMLKGIDQYQVNPKAGFTKTAAVEACFKHHPKALYIQNAEDPEIAAALCREAESGQMLILAGMQAANVFEALEKSIRLGLAPYVSGILNQKCVRRLCDHCKHTYPLSPRKTESLFIWDGQTRVTAYRQAGCPYCKHEGFFGTIGIHELLVINGGLHKMINDKAPIEEIKRHVWETGFKGKGYDGIKKALRGLTTFDEIEETAVKEQQQESE